LAVMAASLGAGLWSCGAAAGWLATLMTEG
jgi:hypothetical protein